MFLTQFFNIPIYRIYRHQSYFKGAKREVENVFSIPIKKLILDKNQRVKNQKVNGKMAVVPYFHLNDQIVWGATSAILSELKTINFGY